MAIRTDDTRAHAPTRPRLPRLVSAPSSAPARPATRPRGRPSLQGTPDPVRPARRLGPAGRVLVVGLGGFLAWILLAAPALEREAATSPLGVRRSAALAVLRPLARVSAVLSHDRVGGVADRLLDRHRFAALPAAGGAEPFRP